MENGNAAAACAAECTRIATLAKKDAKKSFAFWDPFNSPDWDAVEMENTTSTIQRLSREIVFYRRERNNFPGIYIYPDEDNVSRMLVQIRGPENTPYAGILLHFMVRFGPSYPYHPPRVKFLDASRLPLRISPHFYTNGRVCLSILGTYPGPSWAPSCTVTGLLLSLQSILHDLPLSRDSVFGEATTLEENHFYCRIVRHALLRDHIDLLRTGHPNITGVPQIDTSPAALELRRNLYLQSVTFENQLAKECLGIYHVFGEESLSAFDQSAWHRYFIRDKEASTSWHKMAGELRGLQERGEERKDIARKYPHFFF